MKGAIGSLSIHQNKNLTHDNKEKPHQSKEIESNSGDKVLELDQSE